MSEFQQVVKEGAGGVWRKTKRVLLVIFLVALAGFGLYLWGIGWTYSEGARAGYLIKTSRKGTIFKTFEGQLNTGGFSSNPVDGSMGNVWEFSVADRDIYEKLQNLEGKQVKLHYRQRYKSMPWQGETTYFVYQAEEVK